MNVRAPTEEDKWQCGIARNAARLLRCPLVGDGKSRSIEEIWEDPEWCKAVQISLLKRTYITTGGVGNRDWLRGGITM